MPGFLMPMADEDAELEAAEDEEAADLAEGEDGGDGGDGGHDEAAALEAKARKQGWLPRSEYRGDPDDWTPADEYVRQGDPKYLRKELRETRKSVEELRRAREEDAESFKQRLDRFEAMSKAQRAKLYADIETARRQAVEAGDTAEYDRLNQVEADLYEQEQAAGKPPAKKEQKAPDVHPDVDMWVRSNPWFLKDKVLNKAAQGIHEQLMEDEPGLSVTENLAKTKRELMKRFPERFGKTPAKTGGAAPVESGQRMPAARGGKGFGDIPAEERRIIKRHIEEGLYKDEADAAKAYWS